jgi:hypothetical protein
MQNFDGTLADPCTKLAREETKPTAGVFIAKIQLKFEG